MSKFVCNVEKFKGGQLYGMDIHIQRKTDNHSNKDIDIGRSHLNYELVESDQPNTHYFTAVKKRIEQGYTGTKALRKDATLACGVLVSSDKKFFENLTEEQERKFFQTAYEYLCEVYGKENIISAKVHKDETTPHLHAIVVPLTKDGRLTAKELFDRKALTALHNEIPKKLKQRGFDIERGEKNAKVKRMETEEFKRLKEQNKITVHIKPEDVEPKIIKDGVFKKEFEPNEQIAKRLTEKYVKPLTEELSILKTEQAVNKKKQDGLKYSKYISENREDDFKKLYHTVKQYGSKYVDDVLAKVKSLVSGLNEKQENELKAKEQERQKRLDEQKQNNLARLHGGNDDLHKILDWGKAPYDFEENGKPSYYVMAQSLKTGEKIVLWGMHLAEEKYKYEEIIHVKGDKIERATKIQAKASKGMGIS